MQNFYLFTLSNAALGEKCSRSTECFVTAEPDQIECRNAVCECPFGTQKDVERQVCRPVAAKKSKCGNCLWCTPLHIRIRVSHSLAALPFETKSFLF